MYFALCLVSVSPRSFDNMSDAYKTSYDLIFNGETDLFSVYAFTILMPMDFHFIISSHFTDMTAII